MNQSSQENDNRAAWYVLLIIGVLILALAGYAGYVLYPRFDLPAVAGIGLFVLAAAAGIGSFFSPCSFPLLITLLARQTGAGKGGEPVLPRALRFAAALSLGATLFLLLAGAGIAAGGASLFQEVTFTSTAGRVIRAIVGTLLIMFGLIQMNVLPISFGAVADSVRPLQRAQARLRQQKPTASFALFGFGYILAGFGWTGPILAGLAGQALTVGGATAAFMAFIVAAAMMVLLMFVLAVAIATAQERFVNILRAGVGQVKQWGGWVLILVGIWLIATSVWADFFAQFFPVWR